MQIPSDPKSKVTFAQDTIEKCMVSVDRRMSLYRSLRASKLLGSSVGAQAIYNKLAPHIDRLSSYLFSPAELRFHLAFDLNYQDVTLRQAEVASRYLTKQFARKSLDLLFGVGVETSLDYGAAILKLGYGNKGMQGKIILPHAFGVYREDYNDLDLQEAMNERYYVTKEELWRRVSHLPSAQEMFKRACAAAKKKTQTTDIESYFYNVVLSGTSPIISPIQTNDSAGYTSLANSGAILAPEVAESLIQIDEVTILDDEAGDYVTLQVAAPDILITKYKKQNFFLEGQHPYTLVQANRVEGNFWGMSELENLIPLQDMMNMRIDDIKKTMGLQFDRVRAFMGFDGVGAEDADNLNESGFISTQNPGAKIEDITPPMPENAFEELKMYIEFMEDVSGFKNVLGGEGESNVRSGNHAQLLMKTASPRMRDRVIWVERQCSEFGDKAFDLLQAKVSDVFWVDVEKKENDFLLKQIPEDGIVEVDSHSSSPIYEDDHKEIAAFLLKSKVIDGEDVLEMLPNIPMRDLLKIKYKRRQEAEAKLIQQHPELLTKGSGGAHGGKK